MTHLDYTNSLKFLHYDTSTRKQQRKLIECVNPMRNKWRIRWDIQISTNESGVEN